MYLISTQREIYIWIAIKNMQMKLSGQITEHNLL